VKLYIPVSTCVYVLNSGVYLYVHAKTVECLPVCTCIYVLNSGVYLAALVLDDNGRVLVTSDDHIPTVEVDNKQFSSVSSFNNDYYWLPKVSQLFAAFLHRPDIPRYSSVIYGYPKDSLL